MAGSREDPEEDGEKDPAVWHYHHYRSPERRSGMADDAGEKDSKKDQLVGKGGDNETDEVGPEDLRVRAKAM